MNDVLADIEKLLLTIGESGKSPIRLRRISMDAVNSVSRLEKERINMGRSGIDLQNG